MKRPSKSLYLISCCWAVAICSNAATFYIDYSTGKDSNAGTSQAAPWKYCPAMQPFSGSYTHTAGDRFIFKGGVTWPNAALPLYISSGGVSGNPDYYGVDRSWFSGASWSRPVFDAQGADFTNQGGNRGNVVWIRYTGFVTIDNIEMKNYVYRNYVTTSDSDSFAVYVDTANNVLVENVYAHDWIVLAASDSKFGGIGQYSSSGVTVSNCTIVAPSHVNATYVSGPGPATTSGAGTYNIPTVLNCTIIGTSQGIFSPGLAKGNTVLSGGQSFDGSEHENGIYLFANANVYDNVISNWQAGVTLFSVPGWGGRDGVQHIYNNVLINNHPSFITVDPSGSVANNNAQTYIWNNTIAGGTAIYFVPRSTVIHTVQIENNLCIADTSLYFNIGAWTAVSQKIGNNFTMTTAQAFSYGLTPANHYQPATQIPGIYDSGVNLSANFTTDIRGVTRPQGSAWDIGPYEFSAQAGPIISVTPASENFGTLSVGTMADLTLSIQNTGSGTLTGSVTATSPFSIVSGGSYSLAAGQSQTITVRYSPIVAGTNSQTASFSNAGGQPTSVALRGIAVAPSAAPPVVSAISQNAADVDVNVPGLQVYAGSTLEYSGSASDPNGLPLSWQWACSVNGGTATSMQSGTGAVAGVSFTYNMGTAGDTYVWTLSANNGFATATSSLTVGVEAPPLPSTAQTFSAAEGTITSPFVLTNGFITQFQQTTDPTLGGQAVFNFTVTNTDAYVVQTTVSAPNSAANSFYVNIDAQPQAPAMVWDIPPTAGFVQRLVSWRGNGTVVSNQYIPAVFNLATGKHQLIIRGREAGVELQSVAIRTYLAPPTNLRILNSP